MFKVLAISLVCCLAFAAPKPVVVAVSVKAQPSPSTSFQSVVNQILQAMDQLSFKIDNAALYFPADSQMQVKNLNAQIIASFKDNLPITLTTPTSDSSTADLIPKVYVMTKGYKVQITVVGSPKEHPNAIVTNIIFLKDAPTTPLEVDVKSPKIDVIDFRFSSVEIITAGLFGSQGEVTIDGTCSSEEKLVDVDKKPLTVSWQPAKRCAFQGKYDHSGKGGILITYGIK